ncbi:GNAT family N-acetyltransferase [Stappia sp. ES.058]|uniref:GNAT family N-acetyltransferase n=1 Tax=Stappia sp. ES.058 TaxID=1881061 RepID=UPI00087AD8EB|nr:GNAT family N-acetyltransferase [Stappia sp. ES.058]SDU19130.1 Acetyltransferase (GNAT) family protein [Stappia sp. ES.058]
MIDPTDTLAVTIGPALEHDLPDILRLLRANAVGARADAESEDPAPYVAAFRRMKAGGTTTLHVVRCEGEAGAIAGSFELTVIEGLSFQGRPRAQVESVHVMPEFRRLGIGRAIMRFAEARAREAGCVLLQLTSNRAREGSHAFYTALGYDASHIGYKRML